MHTLIKGLLLLLFLVLVGVTAATIRYSKEIRSVAASCDNNPYCEYGLRKLDSGAYVDEAGVIYHENFTVTMPNGQLVGTGTGGYGYQDDKKQYRIVDTSTSYLDPRVTLIRPLVATCDFDQNRRVCNALEAQACGYQMQQITFNSGTHRSLPDGSFTRCLDTPAACNYIAEPITHRATVAPEKDVTKFCNSFVSCVTKAWSTFRGWMKTIEEL